VNNSPVRYNDPTGHQATGDGDEDGCDNEEDCPTTITLYMGGINPTSMATANHASGANAPSNQAEALAEGAVAVGEMIGGIVSTPSQRAPSVTVFLTYVVNPDGTIDSMAVNAKNRSQTDAVVDQLQIGLEDTTILPDASVREGDYSSNTNTLTPSGQSTTTLVCNNCIAEHAVGFFLPIPSETKVTVTAMISSWFNGTYGIWYGSLPVSTTISPR